MNGKISVRVEIDPSCQEPEVIIRAARETALVRRVASFVEQCAREDAPRVMVYRGGSASLLPQSSILRVHTEPRRLVVCADTGDYEARCSLRELEETLDAQLFLRISRFELVNMSRIARFDFNVAGTIQVIFDDGSFTWAARRYVHAIEERLTGQ